MTRRRPDPSASEPRREPRLSREERLAAALRENLGRRKAQARARDTGSPGEDATHSPSASADDRTAENET